MKFQLACLVLGLGAVLPAQVVINEFQYDDSGTDNREYVELYNAGMTAVDISGWTLENHDNGSLPPGGIQTPPPCTPVSIPAMTMLAPGAFYVIGPAFIPNVNLVICGVNWMENDNEGLILKNSLGAVQDVVGYEGIVAPSLLAGLFEGQPIWGNFTSVENTPNAWSRWTDGYDTNNNGADFGLLDSTPGVTNVPVAAVPYCDDFEGRPVDSYLTSLTGSFSRAAIVNPTAPSQSLIIPRTASPDGGNCAVFWDPSGGGNSNLLRTAPAMDWTVEAYVYFRTGIAAAGETEQWSIGVRGTTCTFFNNPIDPVSLNPLVVTANGNTGVAFTYVTSSTASTLYLMDEVNGGASTVLATIPITAGVNDGWQRIRLSVVGSAVSGNLGGTFGNPTSGMVLSGTTATTHPGVAYFGYREVTNPTVVNAQGLLIDRLNISSGTDCVRNYQANQAGSSLDVNGVVGGAHTPAVTTVCTNAPVSANFAGTGFGLPYDVAISVDALLPFPASGIATPMGQIVNVNFVAPSSPILWLNGGGAPDFVGSFFPGPFAIPFGAPPVPITFSFQMANIDPTNPEFISLSQGCQLDVVSGVTITGVIGDDRSQRIDLTGAGPLCASGMTVYGALYTEAWVSSNGFVSFGAFSNTAAPTVALAQSGPARVGVWADLFINHLTGSCTVTTTMAGNIRVQWTNAIAFNSNNIGSTFAVELEPTTGNVTIDGIAGLGTFAAANAFIGITPGNGATNPGVQVFGPAPNVGLVTGALDMTYTFGPLAPIAGVGSIVFSPGPGPNYLWASNP